MKIDINSININNRISKTSEFHWVCSYYQKSRCDGLVSVFFAYVGTLCHSWMMPMQETLRLKNATVGSR